MKNTMKRFLCLLLALVMCAGLAVGAAAADGEKDEEKEEGGSGTDITIQILSEGNKSSVFVGKNLQLSCATYPDDLECEPTWKSSDKSIASVDSSGCVTGIKASQTPVEITATIEVEGREYESEPFSVTVEEDEVTGFTVTGEYLRNGTVTFAGSGSFTLSALTTYKSGAQSSEATWNAPSDLSVISGDGEGTFTAKQPGEATILVECPDDRTWSVEIKVVITDSFSIEISGTGVTGSKGSYSASMTAGSTLSLSAKKQPENTFNEDAITWTSSVPSVATVNESTGAVTAIKSGTTTITAKCGEKSASVTVTVSAPSTAISASVTRGKELSFGSIYNSLVSVYKGSYGKDPTSSSTVTITSIGSSSVGTLYTSAGSAVSKNSTPKLSAVKNFYFVPSAIGSYKLGYSFKVDGSTVSGTVTIEVTGSKTKDITIRLSDDSPYTFSSTATVDNKSAASIISSEIKDASGSSYTYIMFDTSSISPTSKKVGTLYPSSTGSKALDNYRSYTSSTSVTSQQSPVSKLYFEPRKEGTYTIEYTAYNSSSELCSGDLIIEVGVNSGATVTVTLDDDGRYTFSEKTKKDQISAADAIDDAIEDEIGKTYNYIRFGSVVSGDSVGKLYADSDKTDLKTTTSFKRSASAANSVSDLYFVPAKPGTYVRSFTAYNQSGTELLDGTLRIIVPSGSDDDMDIYFNTTTGSTVSLGANVFESWFRQEKGTNYKLAYVTFDDASRSYGSFKHSGASFTPGNEVKYYTEGFTGSTGSSPKHLDKVNFTAPSSTGYVSVDFTCYGGTSSSAYSTKVSGTFFIFVTKGSVKGVTRDVKYGSAATLRESEFSTVHENAMSLGLTSSARYYIKLLEIPSKGTLYYNYTSASKPGTKLTGSNFEGYEFYVNSASSYDSVSDLTYVPANASSGTVSVRYLAYSTSGDPMYVGSVSFNYGKQQSLSVSCNSDGYAFTASDFYSSSDADPVAYVCFSQPEFGELMLGYANGRGVPLDSSVRLYTSNYTNGSYPLSSLSYIPKAGFSGKVDVNYTAVTESGKAQSGVLTISVTKRQSSSHFKDVQSTGSGAWASDAIDYAYKWGLVNGTSADTFSPDSPMTRAMLVTILYRSAGNPKVSGSCPFTDVGADAYYRDAVVWAANNGIVTGTSNTTFSPNRDVNREQVAAFLHRYAKYNGEDVSVNGSLNGYVDKSYVSQYAIEPMSWAVQHGYITSNSGTELLLSPGGNATRAQVAVMLHRFLTY